MSQAGYQKKIQIGDNGSPHTMVDVSATTGSLTHAGDILDDTNMRDIDAAGMRSRIYGLRDWSITMSVLYDVDTADVVQQLKNAWLNRTELFVNYLPDGTVANGFGGPAIVETFNMAGDVGGLETVDISLQAAGVLGDAIN